MFSIIEEDEWITARATTILSVSDRFEDFIVFEFAYILQRLVRFLLYNFWYFHNCMLFFLAKLQK